MKTKNIGMYVHIPFCKQKCRYCDFKSYEGKEQLVEKYIKCVNYEIEEIAKGNKLDYENDVDDLAIIDTIYIGGGTPSFIDSGYIVQILENIKQNYNIVEMPEITIEVNPGTVTKEKLEDYKKCGINRISIGLQTCKNELLRSLGRIHTYEDFNTTYQLSRKMEFANINVDLIIGLPNQTLNDVKESIDQIIKCNPEHVSVYSLILEEGTPLYNDVANSVLKLPAESLERKMYWCVKQKLEENEYIHYEISNFAKKGKESKHNLNCWEQHEYIGVGAAAHSYTNGIRYSNIESIEKYIDNYKNGKQIDNFIFHEKQNKNSQMQEYMLLSLRKISGVPIQKFKNKFGENPIYLYRKELEKLIKENLLEINGDDIKLTKKGLDLANLVWEEFV